MSDSPKLKCVKCKTETEFSYSVLIGSRIHAAPFACQKCDERYLVRNGLAYRVPVCVRKEKAA